MAKIPPQLNEKSTEFIEQQKLVFAAIADTNNCMNASPTGTASTRE